MTLLSLHLPIAFILSLVVSAGGIAPSSDATLRASATTSDSPLMSASTTSDSPLTSAATTSESPLMSASATRRVVARTAIPFTPSIGCGRSGERCVLRYDLYRPVGTGPWPMIVVAPGGPTAPTGGGHLTDFARRLAGGGAVVLVASWRQGDRYGGTVPRAFGDIGCAVRTARSIAPRVSGDAGRIVLLGHSLGGWGGAIVALDPAASTPLPSQCLVRSGSTRPDAFIGIAGAYAGPAGDRDDVDWTDLIGASIAAAPERWAQADPLVAASRRRAEHIPTLLIHGSADTGVAPTQTSRFAAALRRAGWLRRVVVEPGQGHMSVLTTQTTFTEVARLVDALPR